ncbi:MAG: DNA helicase II [Gammaproteobacteria bacterium]
MDVSPILDPLNDAQRQTVCAANSHVLVLAGAGSGKTRVLVHRIAWLMLAENVTPYGILAVTFTNKASGEMRGRIEELLGAPTRALWVGTFHGIAHRLLRAHWKEVGLPQTFQILDSDDQKRTIKRVIREMGLDETLYPAKEAQWYINARKDEAKRPSQISHQGESKLQHMIKIYEAYEASCQRGGLVDFAELLLRAYELFQKNPEVLRSYQERFQHILVDEFQDTNTLQYSWLKLLAGNNGKIFAVGDDDQSIYGWRGAQIENIHEFSKDYAKQNVFRLEQNYRSTGNILTSANKLISNNDDRMGKELWTADDKGKPILIYQAFNDYDEAYYVVDQIREWHDAGGKRAECAILYRSNAQSRVFEESLFRAAIPYRVYGGLRFFERQEIKDVLAYLRLIQNRNDDASFERVVNFPTRGIGNKTVSIVRDCARVNQISMWQATHIQMQDNAFTPRALSALQLFIDLIENLDRGCASTELYEQVEHVIHHSTLYTHYQKEKGEKGQARIENLEELVNAAKFYDVDQVDDDVEEMDPLSSFLTHAALEAGEKQSGEWDDCVQLMTLHSSKGLEFPQVFLGGMEEGLFPHKMSSDDPKKLQEERRLCYVGMTRAMKQLTLSCADKRRLHGEERFARPSRFLSELPDDCIEHVRMVGEVATSVPMSSMGNSFDEFDQSIPEELGMQLGQRVTHAKFGEGIVLNYEGEGKHSRVQINFDSVGSKWLVVAYANLMV